MACGRNLRCGLGLALMVVLVTAPGCEGPMGAPTAPAAVPPPPPSKPFKVVMIRLGDLSELPEPTDKDVTDGFKEGGYTVGPYYTIDSRSANGDPAEAARLIDAAIKEAPDVLMTLHPATTLLATAKTTKIPIAFQMAADPFALGLGKNLQDHAPNVTGAYTDFVHGLDLRIALHCLPKSKKFGILFNPTRPESVAHKDALIRAGMKMVPVVTAEFHSPDEASSAAKSLLDQKVDAIFLVTGIGKGSKAVIEEATRAKVPVFGFTNEQVREGALLSRVPDVRWGGFEAGRRAVRILKSGTPQTIPFAEGTLFSTVVNMNVSKANGWPIPGDLIRDAEQYTGEEKPASK